MRREAPLRTERTGRGSRSGMDGVLIPPSAWRVKAPPQLWQPMVSPSAAPSGGTRIGPHLGQFSIRCSSVACPRICFSVSDSPSCIIAAATDGSNWVPLCIRICSRVNSAASPWRYARVLVMASKESATARCDRRYRRLEPPRRRP